MEGNIAGVVQLFGNRQAVVDGCDGVVDYSGEKILLRMGKLTVQLTGRDLRIKTLTATTAVVEGFLAGVEYVG